MKNLHLAVRLFAALYESKLSVGPHTLWDWGATKQAVLAAEGHEKLADELELLTDSRRDRVMRYAGSFEPLSHLGEAWVFGDDDSARKFAEDVAGIGAFTERLCGNIVAANGSDAKAIQELALARGGTIFDGPQLIDAFESVDVNLPYDMIQGGIPISLMEQSLIGALDGKLDESQFSRTRLYRARIKNFARQRPTVHGVDQRLIEGCIKAGMIGDELRKHLHENFPRLRQFLMEQDPVNQGQQADNGQVSIAQADSDQRGGVSQDSPDTEAGQAATSKSEPQDNSEMPTEPGREDQEAGQVKLEDGTMVAEPVLKKAMAKMLQNLATQLETGTVGGQPEPRKGDEEGEEEKPEEPQSEEPDKAEQEKPGEPTATQQSVAAQQPAPAPGPPQVAQPKQESVSAESVKGKPAHGRTRKQTAKATGKRSRDRYYRGKGRGSRPQAGGGRKFRRGGTSSDYGHAKSRRKEPVAAESIQLIDEKTIKVTGYGSVKLPEGVGVKWSAVNQAWLVTRQNNVMRVAHTARDLVEYLDELRTGHTGDLGRVSGVQKKVPGYAQGKTVGEAALREWGDDDEDEQGETLDRIAFNARKRGWKYSVKRRGRDIYVYLNPPSRPYDDPVEIMVTDSGDVVAHVDPFDELKQFARGSFFYESLTKADREQAKKIGVVDVKPAKTGIKKPWRKTAASSNGTEKTDEAKMTKKGQEFVGKKIRKHMEKGGKPQKQAVAIALSQARKKGFKGAAKAEESVAEAMVEFLRNGRVVRTLDIDEEGFVGYRKTSEDIMDEASRWARQYGADQIRFGGKVYQVRDLVMASVQEARTPREILDVLRAVRDLAPSQRTSSAVRAFEAFVRSGDTKRLHEVSRAMSGTVNELRRKRVGPDLLGMIDEVREEIGKMLGESYDPDANLFEQLDVGQESEADAAGKGFADAAATLKRCRQEAFDLTTNQLVRLESLSNAIGAKKTARLVAKARESATKFLDDLKGLADTLNKANDQFKSEGGKGGEQANGEMNGNGEVPANGNGEPAPAAPVPAPAEPEPPVQTSATPAPTESRIRKAVERMVSTSVPDRIAEGEGIRSIRVAIAARCPDLALTEDMLTEVFHRLRRARNLTESRLFRITLDEFDRSLLADVDRSLAERAEQERSVAVTEHDLTRTCEALRTHGGDDHELLADALEKMARRAVVGAS